MRWWGFVLAVILAATAGYAVALWIHVRPEPVPTLTDVVVEPPPSGDGPADVPPAERATEPPPQVKARPDPTVHRAFRRLGAALREARRAFIEGLLTANGWGRFDHEIPEDVAYRGHEFVREVEAAAAQRWFAPDERGAYRSALDAWRRTRAHAERLRRDRAFRASERMLANIAHAPAYQDLNLVSIAEAPFLLVFASREPLSVLDLPADVRMVPAMRRRVGERRTFALRILRRNLEIHRTVHRELLERFGEALDLRDLSAAFGGRADLPYGVRSYADGVTLASVVLETREARARAQADPFGVRRFPVGLDPRTGMLRSPPEVDGDETAPGFAPWYGGHAARQLLYWYVRQRNRWRKPPPDDGFVTHGVAAWLGGVRFDASGRAVWTGVKPVLLEGMQVLARLLKARGDRYRIAPVRALVSFASRGAVRAWTAGTWQMSTDHADVLIHQQYWALAHLLGRKDGSFEDRFTRFLGLVLHRETGGARTRQAFVEAFRLQDPDDWRRLDAALGEYVLETLLKEDLGPHARKPPKLAVWDG